jgi:hypothetical protein
VHGGQSVGGTTGTVNGEERGASPLRVTGESRMIVI